MLNIVIPMAGHGSRFAKNGYTIPKPFIPIHGKPMIEVVIDNLTPQVEHRFIFICLQKHIEEYELKAKLSALSPGCELVSVDQVTEGAACTVLLAKDLIDNSAPLMIANSDQWVDVDIDDYLYSINSPLADGLIMTMWADDDKWSFVELDEQNKVTRVVEKEVVSNEATVGIYNFRKGSDFVSGAQQMIDKKLTVNNEYYVAPVYNELIENGFATNLYNVGRLNDGMYGLGTPEDLDLFLSMSVSQRAAGVI